MNGTPRPARFDILDPAVLATVLALVGALLVGAAIIYAVDRWRKQSAPVGLSLHEQLAEFRSSYESGELSQEEYNRIRAKLAPKLKREILPNLPPEPPAIPPAPDS